ncbi:MAG: hypothetical protein JW934_06110 [Anaerolineae bacterium]|nr:hypothetical protein [Anaerolineae bacterium]
MDAQAEMARIRAVKARYERKLMKKQNVVGVGIGFREVGGQVTDQLALSVMVRQKLPLDQLRRRDIIPRELDGVVVDVKEVGTLRAEGVN